jgi:crotonobetainyl-CoA:carnitine CoA-transferase CaiB-like acyl-CoA transferase
MFDEEKYRLQAAPEHGQHTEELLLELGIGWDAIAAYKDSGAIL